MFLLLWFCSFMYKVLFLYSIRHLCILYGTKFSVFLRLFIFTDKDRRTLNFFKSRMSYWIILEHNILEQD